MEKKRESIKKKIIKSQFIQLDSILYEIKFFQIIRSSRQISYSSEVVFDSDNYEKIIIDDQDLSNLENKILSIVPIAHQSRMLAKMNSVR